MKSTNKLPPIQDIYTILGANHFDIYTALLRFFEPTNSTEVVYMTFFQSGSYEISDTKPGFVKDARTFTVNRCRFYSYRASIKDIDIQGSDKGQIIYDYLILKSFIDKF